VSAQEFFNNCTACGGNWCGMILTGIRKLFPHRLEDASAIYNNNSLHDGEIFVGLLTIAREEGVKI
jgi:hypothetical protein